MICVANLLHLPQPQYNQNWLLFFRLSEFRRLPLSEIAYLTASIIAMQICGIRIAAQHFIEGFIATIAGRKIITLPVVPSRSLVELNAKQTDEQLMNYTRALANTLEDQALYQVFRHLNLP